MGNQFIMPGKIVYGENALNDAKELIADFGKKLLSLLTGLWYALVMFVPLRIY